MCAIKNDGRCSAIRRLTDCGSSIATRLGAARQDPRAVGNAAGLNRESCATSYVGARRGAPLASRARRAGIRRLTDSPGRDLSGWFVSGALGKGPPPFVPPPPRRRGRGRGERVNSRTHRSRYKPSGQVTRWPYSRAPSGLATARKIRGPNSLPQLSCRRGYHAEPQNRDGRG
jgi:hypothetical protein